MRALPLIGGVVALLAFAGTATAASPPREVRAAVAAEFAKAADEGQAASAPPAAMFRAVDINGDGRSDWLVDYGKAPVPAMWCGTGGCRVELWVSQPENGGWAKVTEAIFRDIRISRSGGITRMDADFHGALCGGYGPDNCARAYKWDEDIGWVAIASAQGGSWLYRGPMEMNLYERGSRPPEVVQVLEGFAAASCRGETAAGRTGWEAIAIPDINGDGGRDWVVGSPWTRCPGAEDPLPMVILTSTPEGDLAEAWRGPAALFGVDIATSPATLYLIPAGENCALKGPCGRPMTWTDGKLSAPF